MEPLSGGCDPEHDGRALKTIGFNNISAGIQVLPEDVTNSIRAGYGQILVAVFERSAVKIGRSARPARLLIASVYQDSPARRSLYP